MTKPQVESQISHEEMSHYVLQGEEGPDGIVGSPGVPGPQVLWTIHFIFLLYIVYPCPLAYHTYMHIIVLLGSIWIHAVINEDCNHAKNVEYDKVPLLESIKVFMWSWSLSLFLSLLSRFSNCYNLCLPDSTDYPTWSFQGKPGDGPSGQKGDPVCAFHVIW